MVQENPRHTFLYRTLCRNIEEKSHEGSHNNCTRDVEPYGEEDDQYSPGCNQIWLIIKYLKAVQY